MTKSKHQKLLFKLRWLLLISKRNPEQHLKSIKLLLMQWLKNYPAILYYSLRLLYPLKSTHYSRLMVAYINNHSSDDIETLIKHIPSKDNDARTFKIRKILYKGTSNLNQSKLNINKITDFIDLETQVYQPLREITNLKLEHYLTDLGGANNYGMILHTHNEAILYITKIKRIHNHPSNFSIEKSFYTNIVESSEQLKQHVPKLISMSTDGQFGFFTMSYIHGREPQIEDLISVLEFEVVLIGIDLDFIRRTLNNKVEPYILSPAKVLAPLSKKRNLQILHRIVDYADDKAPNEKLKISSLLEKIIIIKQLHKRINIKNDLVLQHRDFGWPNIRIDQFGKLIVIDWDVFSLGIPGSDTLGFIMRHRIDFEFIEKNLFHFLKKENISNFHVITCYLTIHYLDRLVQQPEGINIEENWNLAFDYLEKSPLNS
jgi:hypothetical protein